MLRSARPRVPGLCLIAALSLAAAPAAPPAGDHPPGCALFAGTVTRALMERPIGLRPEAGRLHLAVSTGVPKAQEYHDQGLAYLASYAWVDAARSFNEALRLDPSLAMAELGLADAYAGAEAEEEAASHLKKAQELAGKEGTTPRERTLVALAAQQQAALAAPEKDRKRLHEAYKKAIDDLIETDPSDPFSWNLRGNAEEPGAWGRGQGGGVGSIAYYETALARDPGNLAAHHFLVHSYEHIGRHAEAAEHGRSYLAQAPGIPHAHHMLGHVLPRLGRWEEALERFREADDLERETYRSETIAAEEDWHHGHNLHLLGYTCLRLGRAEEAGALLKEAFDLEPRGPADDPQEYGVPYVEYLILQGRFQEAIEPARAVQRRGGSFGRLAGASLEGEALLALGRLEEARRALKEAERSERAMHRASGGGRFGYSRRQSAQQIRTLRGLLQVASGDAKAGSKELLAMADAIAESPLFDAWGAGLFRLQRIAAQAMRAGHPELAAELGARMKKIDPDYPLPAEWTR